MWVSMSLLLLSIPLWVMSRWIRFSRGISFAISSTRSVISLTLLFILERNTTWFEDEKKSLTFLATPPRYSWWVAKSSNMSSASYTKSLSLLTQAFTAWLSSCFSSASRSTALMVSSFSSSFLSSFGTPKYV